MNHNFLYVLAASLLSLCWQGASAADYRVWPSGRVLTRQQVDTLTCTTVLQSSDSPTGYYVTFRFPAPQASRVRIMGEWLFSSPDDATMVTGTDAMPDNWHNGYILYTPGRWPISEMYKNKATGVWCYTVPLPCGTYNYRFYVDGKADTATDDVADARMAWDPVRKPLQASFTGIGNLSEEEFNSSVYVPWDEERQSLSARREEECPRCGRNGRSFVVSLNDSLGSAQVDFAVYLPCGFDKSRTAPYPVLVLMHGGGGTESSWINNGLANIMDNMTAEGRVQPTVVLCPNGSDQNWNRPEILRIVLQKILPYAESHFNISANSDQRAFAGLSMGGATTMYALFHETSHFLYFLAMSPPLTEDVRPEYGNPLLKSRRICITMGQYDFVKRAQDVTGEGSLPGHNKKKERSIYQYIYGLKAADIPFKTTIELPYGHTWQLWRANIVHWIDHYLWK